MNIIEMNKTSQKSILKNKQKAIFAGGNWEDSSKLISSIVIPKNSIAGGDESFLKRSEVFPVLMSQVNTDEISIIDLVNLSFAAKAIEDGDTKCGTFLRDTGGGKPVEKHVIDSAKISDLTDKQIEYILEHAEVEEDGN